MLNNNLISAVKQGCLDSVKYLVENGSEINWVSMTPADGSPPLHCAYKSGYLEIIRYLLESGADVNQEDRYGYLSSRKLECVSGVSLLQRAVHRGDLQTIHYLVSEKNVNINAVIGGCAAIHLATEAKNFEIVKYLLENGADVNTQDVNGDSPLHYSCVFIDTDPFYTLYFIAYGANLKLVNQKGETPLTALETHIGYQNIVSYFLKPYIQDEKNFDTIKHCNPTVIYDLYKLGCNGNEVLAAFI